MIQILDMLIRNKKVLSSDQIALSIGVSSNDYVKALTGINFPVLMEIALSKDYTDDIEQLLSQSITNAREALMEIKLEA